MIKGGDNYSGLSEERKASFKKTVGQSTKNWWAKLSDSEKADVIARRTKTFKDRYANLSEEQRKNWYAKASKAQSDFYQTDEGKLSLTEKISKGVTTKSNWTPEEREKIGNKISEARNAFSDEKWLEITKKESESQKAVWAKLSKEEKAEKLALARQNVKKITFVGKNGSLVKADSSWEQSTYQLFQKLMVEFRYANTKEDNCWLDLGDRIWFPDFILNDRNLIIEVKGFYPAKVKFDEIILPAFLNSQNAEKYTLALCEFNPKIDRYTSLDEFFSDLNWVHVASDHVAEYEKFVRLSSSSTYRKRRT